MTSGVTRTFAAGHGWDRSVFLTFMLLIWCGILMGFVPEIVAKFHKDGLSYPIIVHFHAAVFIGWLSLLTTQVFLIRSRNVALHRKLGAYGAGLAGLVVVLGLSVSIIVDHIRYGTPDGDTPFLSIQLIDIINFGALATAGLLMRKDPAAHKRLMLLATIFIADAGFARWWGPSLEHTFGKGFFGEWMADYVGDFLLVVAFAAYDLISRRRLHPAFVIGATFGLGMQLVAIWLYVSPWWQPVATKLIEH